MSLNSYLLVSLATCRGLDLADRKRKVESALSALPSDLLRELGLSLDLAQAQLDLDQLLAQLDHLDTELLDDLLTELDKLGLDRLGLSPLPETELLRS